MNRRRPPLSKDLHDTSSPTYKLGDFLGDFHLPMGNFRHQSDGSVLYHSITRGVVLGDTLHELDDVVSEDESFLRTQP